MSATFLHVDFAFPGPWGPALAEACRELAADIAAEPGLRWKLWGEDPAGARASGEYLFDTREQAERYLDKHRARLAALGVAQVHAQLYEVNAPLSAVTRGPLDRPAARDGAPATFTTLARVRIADPQRFLDVFSTRGLAKRRAHGSRGAQAFVLPDEPGVATVLIDWADRAGFDAFRADPEVPPTMRSGSALEPPQFTVLERRGRYEA